MRRIVCLKSALPAGASIFLSLLATRLRHAGVEVVQSEARADLIVDLLTDEAQMQGSTEGDADRDILEAAPPRLILLLGAAGKGSTRPLAQPLVVPLPGSFEEAADIAAPIIWGLVSQRRAGAELSHAHHHRHEPLLSRDAAHRALEREWRRSLRNGGELSLALFDCGEVYAFDASVIEDALSFLSLKVRRAGDFVFRYDKRVLGATIVGSKPEDAGVFANDLAVALGARIMGEGTVLAFSVVSEVPTPGSECSTLLKRAYRRLFDPHQSL